MCYTLIYIYIYIHFHILFHYGLSQEIGYSFLCCTVGTCSLSILSIIVCIYQPQTPSPFPPQSPPSWQPQVCFLSVSLFFVDRDICVIIYISHMSDITWYLSSSF